MKLQETSQGTVIEVFVKPRANQFHLKIEDDELVVFCRETPVKGKANRELVRELSRLFKRNVEIVSGFASKKKRILIRDVTVEEIRAIFSNSLLLS